MTHESTSTLLSLVSADFAGISCTPPFIRVHRHWDADGGASAPTGSSSCFLASMTGARDFSGA
jgi:hypothetical protein